MQKYTAQDLNKCVLMSRREVRDFDRWAIESVGIPGAVLMENAGRSCAELIVEKLSGINRPKVCIFCGMGNNGGDGYVIARHLLNNSFEIAVIICGQKDKIKGDAKINLDVLERLDRPLEQLSLTDGDICGRVKKFANKADMLVDCIFGTGLKGELSEEYQQLIKSINAQGRPVVAVDIPSGLDCDTGEALGCAVEAVATVTFVAAKKGFANAGAKRYTGDVFVASIGIEPQLRSNRP